MTKILPGFIFLLFAVSTAVFSQTGNPSPTPDGDVVKISTNLIQLDVAVTDKKGKPITDLRADEIEIYENGEKQRITNFSFISAARGVAAKPPPPDTNAVPVPPVTLRPEDIRRTFALVVDDLTLSFDSAYYTRRALKKFVDEQMQPGDLVAIVRTGAGIGALQQFTSDKRILYAAIDKVQWNPISMGGMGAFAPINERSPAEASLDLPTTEGGADSLDDFRGSAFATTTLGALRYIVSGMRELPGRKSVILFSHGFKLVDTSDMFSGTSLVLDFVKILVDEANRSSVVFYAIDTRGLAVTGLTAADSVPGISADSMSRLIGGRSRLLQDTQNGLRYLTRETGGFAHVNSNDLSGGIRRVLEDQSYYLVGYIPESDTFDPAKRKFNKIEVKVLRPDTDVRYRSGFINVADRERPPAADASNANGVTRLHSALFSPFALNEINLSLNALFGVDAAGGAFVRSVLHVDASDMQFTDDKDGGKKMTFAVLAASFGDNGRIVEQLGRTYTLTLNPERYKRILAKGFVYHFAFPVKKAGAYQYRVAIRDSGSGQVGSASQFIEVPDLKKKRLTTSSLVIENLSADEWQRSADANATRVETDPMSDTALRNVRLDSVLRYGFEIYNAKLDNTKRPKLSTRIRVFRDGKLVLDGKPTPVETSVAAPSRVPAAGAIAIGNQMIPGDYILQIIVTDELANKKHQIATQFVQFEVVP